MAYHSFTLGLCRIVFKFSMVGARKNKSGKESFENTKLYEAITGES